MGEHYLVHQAVVMEADGIKRSLGRRSHSGIQWERLDCVHKILYRRLHFPVLRLQHLQRRNNINNGHSENKAG